MFDSLIDAEGHEWQTKAFDCDLARWRIGDKITHTSVTCQVEVLGDPTPREFVDAYATVRKGVLVAVPDERKPAMPLLDYYGYAEGN